MNLLKRHPAHPTRREIMSLAAAGVAGTSVSGWMGSLAAAAQTSSGKGKAKSCILLWMDGGPSHVETFDPKPDAGMDIHGDLGAISTSVPGIQIGEKFPQLAKLMHHGAIIRGMSTPEADHGRARVYIHTGYRPGQGGINYPGIGSTVSAELARDDSPLPNFVVTGEPLVKHDVLRDPGYRGPQHQPLVLTNLSRGLENAASVASEAEFDQRVRLLGKLDQRFAQQTQSPAAQSHLAGIASAVKLMRSDKRDGFDLSREPAASAAKYGAHDFGRGCLLARRLVEKGVAFIEVYLSNWDSHVRESANKTRDLMTQVDQGMSSLIQDLHDRSLLDSTLILWMGEFGRSPKINAAGGRDHHARAWSTALFGGGIKTGQVIGTTDATGDSVKERPVGITDFMATVCHQLGIDHTKEIDTPSGRPIRIVDKGEQIIRELVG